jgi:hypothetical protein
MALLLTQHINAGSFALMTSMIFAFLCFTGIFVMFFYLMRSLEKFQERMRDEHAQLRVQMRALEVRLDMLTGAAPGHTVLSRAPAPDDAQAPLSLDRNHPLDDALDDPLMRFEPRR